MRSMQWVAVGLVWLLLAAAARAGGGPENVLLVVNRESPASRTIANYYQHWRKIPPGNVLTIPWPPAEQSTDATTFREKILEVILKELDKRRLTPQIDYIVYSSDFPTAIDISADVNQQGNNPLAQVTGTTGSLTGLTYLWQPVMLRRPYWIDPSRPRMPFGTNCYMRRDIAEQKDAATVAFSAQQNFGPEGELLDKPGRRYLLSVMLGVTAGRGNTLQEVLGYLGSAQQADGVRPKGTIYFAKNADIRSTVRDKFYPGVVRELKALGVNAEIVDGVLPVGKKDVQGAMVGAADFSWKTSRSTILPGAICEHFTSYGGIMTSGAGQTPLSEWLRYGAAGTSGTVVEPYAILDKFPAPAMHVHYARGCSLAESFYQAVFGPYQLLIVGDPLCQPWAKTPKVEIAGSAPDEVHKGKVELRPSASVPGGGAIDHFELFVDELRHGACKLDGVLTLDTTQLADGWHELRVVAVEASPIRSQGRRVWRVEINNRDKKLVAKVTPQDKITAETTITVSAAAAGATGIVVLHNGQLLGRINGPSGECQFTAGKMARGPVTLRVIALAAAPGDYVFGKPIELTVN